MSTSLSYVTVYYLEQSTVQLIYPMYDFLFSSNPILAKLFCRDFQ